MNLGMRAAHAQPSLANKGALRRSCGGISVRGRPAPGERGVSLKFYVSTIKYLNVISPDKHPRPLPNGREGKRHTGEEAIQLQPIIVCQCEHLLFDCQCEKLLFGRARWWGSGVSFAWPGVFRRPGSGVHVQVCFSFFLVLPAWRQEL